MRIFRGTDVAVQMELRDEMAQPVNLSGCVIYFTIKRNRDDDASDSAALVKVDISEHSDPAAGKTELRIPNEVTRTLSGGTYYFDVVMRDAAGRRVQLSDPESEQVMVVVPVTNRG